MKKIKISAGLGYESPATFVVLKSDYTTRELREGRYYTVLGAQLYNGSLMQLKSVNATFSQVNEICVDDMKLKGSTMYGEKGKLEIKLTKIREGYENVHISLVCTKFMNDSVIFGVEEEDFCEGLYNKLMTVTKLPLKREWMPYLMKMLTENRILCHDVFVVAADDSMGFSFGGRHYPLSKLTGMSFLRTPAESTIQYYLEQGVSSGEISVTPSGRCMDKMILADLDSYRLQYGEQFVENVRKLVKEWYGLKGGVEESFLYGNKRLFKQQGAIVNAVADCFFHHRENTLWLIEQMGSGKSIQSIAAIEQTESLRALATHPGMTPEELHGREGNLNYRVIVMAPGHLVQKWAKEIKENIPYAKVKVIESLADCEAIRKKGPARDGKEFFIVGKDLAKLGCMEMPAPVKVGKQYPVSYSCRACGENYSAEDARDLIKKKAVCKCGKNLRPFRSLSDFRGMQEKSFDKVEGLVCPSCGKVLVKKTGEGMMPWDFLNKKAGNETCPHCGEGLWKPLAKNIGGKPAKDGGWHKVAYFKNHTKKDTDTGWVLTGYEEDTYTFSGIITDGLKESNPLMTRKWPPARFIKEKLHGYFDFAIFDELHEYKAGNSAQAIAMHAVAKASRQTIGLTGTIAGGFASDLFYTMWRLAPHIMKDAGYTYGGENGFKAFVAKYGTLETKYSVSEDGTVNKMSRGKKNGEARPAPGISPDIFGDILMPITLFLDLTDMSNKLPPLNEQVVSVDMDQDVRNAYDRTLARIKAAMGHSNFLSSLSSEMLNFSLLYPDLPVGYNKEKIIDPKNGRCVDVPAVFPEDRVYPKEEKMLEIINKELDEGRRVFVYVEYSQTKLPERYKKLICEYCGLDDKEVEVLRGSSPSASKREEWIHRKAASGVKVVITNPKNVCTGLDFIFEYEGKKYNYPTLIFAECGTNLFTLWQASRRHFRLNQTEECRTYYLCYENTNQAKIIRLMAEKQVATSSIQGKFSMEGLQAMAQSVDPRLILMQSLIGATEDAREDANRAAGIFASLNEATGMDESIYGPSETRLYKEVYKHVPSEDISEIDGTAEFVKMLEAINTDAAEPKAEEAADEAAVPEIATPEIKSGSGFFDGFFDGFTISQAEAKILSDIADEARNRSRKRVSHGQMSLFDLYDVAETA